MPWDYFTLGTTPTAEDCAQVGSPTYHEQSRQEAQRFIAQLRRTFGEEPEGARLGTKTFQHDFGTYVEVAIHFDTDNPQAIDYACKLDEGIPAYWDTEAFKD